MQKKLNKLLIITALTASQFIYAADNYNLPYYQIIKCELDLDKTSDKPTPFRFNDVEDKVDIFTDLISKNKYYSSQLLIYTKNNYIINNIQIIEYSKYFELSGQWQTAYDGKRRVSATINKPIDSFNLTIGRILEDSENPDNPIPAEYEELNKLANKVFNCQYVL